jgi:hypothetical protein
MRKFIYIILIIIFCLANVLFLVSCNKDDEIINEEKNQDDANNDNNQEKEVVSISDLINDELFKTEIDNGFVNKEITNEDYLTLLESTKPLEKGESYFEDWSNSIYETRLRPYVNIYEIRDIEAQATYEIIKGSQNYVKIKTNGSVGGVNDYVQFRGMRFTSNSTYSVEITYTTVTANRSFYLGWGHYEKNIVAMPGGNAGSIHTVNGEFYVEKYTNNSSAALDIVINGGVNPAEIIINSIKITRLDIPEIENAIITGNTEIGEDLSLNYDFIASETEGATQIMWYTCTNVSQYNKEYLYQYDNLKHIKIDSNIQNKYLLAEITPCTNSGIKGTTVSVLTSFTIGYQKAFDDVNMINIGDTFTENFEDIDSTGNISFYTGSSASKAYLTTQNENVLSGNKSLRMIYTGTSVETLCFTDIFFAANSTVKIEFDYKFNVKPNSMYILLRSDTLGINKDAVTGIVTFNEGHAKVYLTIGDASDYSLSFYVAYQAYDLLIDNLSITLVDSTEDNNSYENLSKINGKIFDDCYEQTAIVAGYHTYQPSRVYLKENGIENYSIFMDGSSQDCVLHLFNMSGKIPKGTYEIIFDTMYTTDKSPTKLVCGFRDDKIDNQIQQSIILEDIIKNQIKRITIQFTLDTDNYYGIFQYLSGDGSSVLIDNLTLTRIS